MTTLRNLPFRPISGFLDNNIWPNNIELYTSSDIDGEYWDLIEPYAESYDLFKVLSNGYNISNYQTSKKIFRHFQAYIRQSKNYYFAAKSNPYRSAGLIYYYSFLNLVKAGIVLNNTDLAGRKLVHGLKISSQNKFQKHSVKPQLHSGSVFKHFYEWNLSCTTPNYPFSIRDLLAYCSEISYQYAILGYGKKKLLSGFSKIALNEQTKKGWIFMAINDYSNIQEYKKTFNKFPHLFGKVTDQNIYRSLSKELFGLDAKSASYFDFFYSIEEKPFINNDIPPQPFQFSSLMKDAFNDHLQNSWFPHQADFYVTIPYKIHRQYKIDESISIYLIMYYLSYIVRYSPEYFEKLTLTKDGPLILSFIRSCPSIFVRMIISKILNKNYIIKQRI